jgi:hypothetical protein
VKLRTLGPGALLLLAACVPTRATGLLPESPPPPAFEADSARPTLRWEALDPPGAVEVTYEVRLFMDPSDPPEKAFYSRAGLRDPRHTIDAILEPARTYYWTVRAHFSVDGRPRHTQWSGFARPDSRSALLPGPPPLWFPLRTPRP